MCKRILIALFCCISFGVQAQQYDTVSIFNAPIQMDEVVIKAARGGWDVNAFIKRIQNDTTFYKAFLGMRMVSYNALNDIKVYDKKGKVTASMYSKTRQNRKDNCRTMDVLEERTTGDFYKKNGRYNYFTAQLYAYLFFTFGTVCDEDEIVATKTGIQGGGATMEKYANQLKRLIFNPGSKISGVPFMGDRASIFDPDQVKHYDFKLLSETYDGEDCYVFKVIPKPDDKEGVVFNDLSTWFRKTDYSIVARDYSLSYNTMVYDFNVRMKVRTAQIGERLLPTDIYYDGNWDIIAKKRERVKFEMHVTY